MYLQHWLVFAGYLYGIDRILSWAEASPTQIQRFSTSIFIAEGRHSILSNKGKSLITCVPEETAYWKFRKYVISECYGFGVNWMSRKGGIYFERNLLLIRKWPYWSYANNNYNLLKIRETLETIMDQIIHNFYDIFIIGNASLFKRHGLSVSIINGKAGDDEQSVMNTQKRTTQAASLLPGIDRWNGTWHPASEGRPGPRTVQVEWNSLGS